jgi:hypothetical protein
MNSEREVSDDRQRKAAPHDFGRSGAAFLSFNTLNTRSVC